VPADYEQAKLSSTKSTRSCTRKCIDADVTQKIVERCAKTAEDPLDLEEERTRYRLTPRRLVYKAQQSTSNRLARCYDLRRTRPKPLHVRAGLTGVLQLLGRRWSKRPGGTTLRA